MARHAATARAPVSSVMYSTGDLPSTRARNKPASSAAARPSRSPAWLPVDAGRVRRGQPVEALRGSERSTCGRQHAFEQQVIETEREVEGGSPHQAHCV